MLLCKTNKLALVFLTFIVVVVFVAVVVVFKDELRINFDQI